MEKGWSWYQLNKEGVFLLPLGSYDFFFVVLFCCR